RYSSYPLTRARVAKAHAEKGSSQTKLLIEFAAEGNQSAETFAILADACRLVGDADRAKEFVDEALRKNRKLAAALVTRAELQTGKEALADIAGALAIDPNCARAYFIRATLPD